MLEYIFGSNFYSYFFNKLHEMLRPDRLHRIRRIGRIRGKQSKNYPWTYSDTFLQILSVKNNSNFIFLQFCVFVCGPIPKNENAEFAEGFKKLQKFTESVLDSGCSAQIGHLLPMFIYTDYFSNLLLSIWTSFQTKNWKMELRLPKWKQILAHVQNKPHVFK